MQEVTSLTQILPLVAAGASVLLALGAAALSAIFFFMYTRLSSRAENAMGGSKVAQSNCRDCTSGCIGIRWPGIR